MRGAYGVFFLKFLHNIKEPAVFLDVGANQGLYALLAVQNKNFQEIHAFEPIKSTYDFLLKNIDINDAQIIKPHCLAISNKTAEEQMFCNPRHSGVATLRSDIPGWHPDKVTINTIAYPEIESIVKNKDLPIIVKIDTEGYEAIIVEELIKCTFFDKVTHIFYEVHEERISSNKLQEALEAQGFASFKKIGTGKKQYDVLASRS
jgi:FkbM family methyltransferase